MSDALDVNNPIFSIFLFISFLSFLPAVLIMFTSFTRIVVILSFLRQALGGQQTPPNPVIIGLSLFITLFVMFPTLDTITKDAVSPYIEKKINIGEALKRAETPIKTFMLKQTRQKDLSLFFHLSKEKELDQILAGPYLSQFFRFQIKHGCWSNHPR